MSARKRSCFLKIFQRKLNRRWCQQVNAAHQYPLSAGRRRIWTRETIRRQMQISDTEWSPVRSGMDYMLVEKNVSLTTHDVQYLTFYCIYRQTVCCEIESKEKRHTFPRSILITPMRRIAASLTMKSIVGPPFQAAFSQNCSPCNNYSLKLFVCFCFEVFEYYTECYWLSKRIERRGNHLEKERTNSH